MNQYGNVANSVYIPKAISIAIVSGKGCLPRTTLCQIGVDLFAFPLKFVQQFKNVAKSINILQRNKWKHFFII